MRKSRWAELVALSLAIVVGMYSVGIISFGNSGLDGLSALESEGDAGEVEGRFGPAEPDDGYLVLQRAGGPGKVLNPADIKRAQQQALRLANENAAAPASAPRQLRGAWTNVGPTNIGGRIVDLVVDPSQPDTIYVAAATGGVWKSTDAAVTMEYAWSNSLPQGMGAIAIGSNGRLWAGTGELNPGGGSITFPGGGLFSSDDGGATWQSRGLANSGTTGRIAVDPSDPNTIFVAAGGSLFNPGGERGVYRSTNGGLTWHLVLAPETPFSGGTDLAIDPANPDRIFAAMWDHRREPDLRTYGGVGSGLFRSDDGGDTWTRLDNVLTFTGGDATGLASDVTLGRVGVALAPGNPDRLYVVTGTQYGGNKGFYVSDDGGASFNTRVYPGQQGGFQWWFARLWVDPVNENHVFVAGVSMRRSTNGGTSWSNVGGLHADQHAMAWDLNLPNRVYVGNDGGTYRSNNNGASGFVQAVYEPYTQFYTVDVGEQFPERQTGGTQDNGCNRSWDYPNNPGNPDNWNSYGCGDGLGTLIDPVNNDIYYGCSQYGSCIRRYDGPAPAPVTNATISNGTTSQRRNWLTPVVFDPNDPSILYYGGNVLNKSTNYGSSWTRISPPEIDLTGTFESPDRVDPAYPNWGTITTIAVAKTAPDTIFLGTDTGRLWKTSDGGATWTEFLGKGLPTRWVTRVAIDPTNADVVYATFSGYRNGETAANVFITTDGGTTWENVSGNLPNAPVNDLVFDTANSTVFVGTDVGVYYLKNSKKNWKPAGVGLPIMPVMDIRLHEGSNRLYAATFGRGIWTLEINP